MRRILYLLMMLTFVCCKKTDDKKAVVDYTTLPAYTADGRRINNTNDTIHVYDGYYSDLYVGGYEVLQPGDTVVDPIKEGYPDTVKVAFTRDGVFEDSIDVERMPGGDFGLKYVYVHRCVVGDAFYYTRDGKFLKSVCVDLPHAGQGQHHYKP